MSGMRVGKETVGRTGLAVLGTVAVIGVLLGLRGLHAPGLSGLQSANGVRTPAGAHRPTGGGRTRPTAGNRGGKAGPLLSSTPYAQYAFRLYPGTITAATRQALAGFNVSVRQTGSQVRLEVVIRGTSQPPIRHMYPNTDSIYFIEASMGDDPGLSEYNFGDDGLVVTNSQGQIVG